GSFHLEVELRAGFAREGPAMGPVVLEAAGDQQPRAVVLGSVIQRHWLVAEIRIAGAPADVEHAAAGDDFGRAELDEGGRGVDLDPAVRGIAAGRRGAAEAVAVRDRQADAENAFAGQVDLGRALTVRVF